MVRFHLAGNPVSCSEFLEDELRIFTAGTEVSTIEIERLKRFTKVCFLPFLIHGKSWTREFRYGHI